MASTDTRSGFRLPWSSDRSHDDEAPEAAADTGAETEAQVEVPAEPNWPEPDFNAALGLTSDQRPPEPTQTPAAEAQEPSPMVDMDTRVATPTAPPAPKKPSKLMADLTAAILATAEAAQAQTLEQVAVDSAQVVERIRASSTDGAAALKHQTEDDVAAIREWSKAEIARIREETDARITARKASLDDELAAHAAAVERRVEDVRAEVARFEVAMAAYRDRLMHESDPSRLATMAEELPELPSFDTWADLGTLDVSAAATAVVDAPADEAPVEAPEAVIETTVDAADDTVAVETVTEPEAAPADAAPAEEPQAVLPADDWYAPADEAPSEQAAGGGWDEEPNAWGTGTQDAGVDGADDVPRWAAGEVPDGFPSGDTDESGDPVDRGAIMAALEAAAEAVVAAEAAAESAETAEAAADVAEMAAELLVGRTGGEDDYDPEAAAAMAARVDAGGYETESYTDRLASLLPNHDGGVGDEVRTTQVIVSGLVSVASIASFKRHLGRLAGVQSVAVASGPEGEFMFNVTHRADLSFRDVIPTMPGFAARVTGTGDGVVNVTARDPESES